MIARVQAECTKIGSAEVAGYVGKMLDDKSTGLASEAQKSMQSALNQIELNPAPKSVPTKDLYLLRAKNLQDNLRLFLDQNGDEIPGLKENFISVIDKDSPNYDKTIKSFDEVSLL